MRRSRSKRSASPYIYESLEREFMDASKKVFISDGAITLPQEVLHRYGLSENMPVRIVETRCGILLVPLTDEQMSETLRAEMEEWQAIGARSLEMFPF
jgi:bifunctional DNA-binding transcriptional regulator/antitoxin component of YhaV-PrlF toxin-antitoxin module